MDPRAITLLLFNERRTFLGNVDVYPETTFADICNRYPTYDVVVASRICKSYDMDTMAQLGVKTRDSIVVARKQLHIQGKWINLSPVNVGEI